MALADLFNDIADAIREKDGTSAEIVASTFPARIRAIPSGIDGTHVESIAIISPPTRIIYSPGEVFNPAGMVAQIRYSNGMTVFVNNSDLRFDPSGPIEDGTTSITVIYQMGFKRVSATQPILVLDYSCAGIMWDYSNDSTLLTRLGPESDPNGYVNLVITTEPIPAIGNSLGSSPFDDILPWCNMEEYNIINGKVSYKKGDPEFSRSNDTAVFIPEFYYECINDKAGMKRYWYVSNREIPGMQKHPGSKKYISKYKVNSSIISRSGNSFMGGSNIQSASTNCAGKGIGFHLCNIQVWSALQLLYLVEFANWDSQKAIGGGRFNRYAPTGLTDFMEYHTGRVDNSEWPQVVYRGIEGLFGNALQLLGNVNVENLGYFVSMDGDKYEKVGSFSGHSNASSTPLDSITKLVFNENYKFVFLPEVTISNGDGKYIPDGIYFSSSGRNGLTTGGYSGQKYNGGLFSYYTSYGETSNYGFRYIFDPEEKVEEVV